MIRRSSILLIVAVLLGGISGWHAPAEAQELTIAYIRSASILDDYQKARATTETFNRDVRAWNEEAQNRRRDLDVLNRELSAQAPMLSDAVRREKEQDYQQKLNEYDQFVQSVWGPGGLVAQRNEELFRDIVERIQLAAQGIAEEEGYDFVFDASDGNIIWADRTHDLTQRVLEVLNQQE